MSHLSLSVCFFSLVCYFFLKHFFVWQSVVHGIWFIPLTCTDTTTLVCSLLLRSESEVYKTNDYTGAFAGTSQYSASKQQYNVKTQHVPTRTQISAWYSKLSKLSNVLYLTTDCCVNSNVYVLGDIHCIRYHTVVDPGHSTSSTIQTYHHLTSTSVEIPLITKVGNSSSIGKEPIPNNRHIVTSIRRSATSS